MESLSRSLRDIWELRLTPPTTTISVASSTTAASSQPESVETDPVLVLPFTAAEDPLRIMPMGETVNHDPPKGHPGIDFQWEGSATVRASLPGEVVEITQPEPNDFAVSVIYGPFVVSYKHLGSVAPGLGVGDEIDYGEPIGNPMPIQGTPMTMIHWEFGTHAMLGLGDSRQIVRTIRECPLGYFSDDAMRRLATLWTVEANVTPTFPDICNDYYADPDNQLLAKAATSSAPTTTVTNPAELAAVCTFDESVPKISCQAVGATQGSQLRWESNVYGWMTGTLYEVELVEQYQLVPEVAVTLQECQGSECKTVYSTIDTSGIAQTPSTTESGDYGGDTSTADSPTSTASEDAELAAICSVDNVQHRLTCEASGGRGGSLAWSSDAPGFGTDAGLTYSRQLEWGLVLDRINVNLEECLGSDCSTVTSTVELSLQPRGDCPNSFDGWLETFPLSDLSVITEVEAPARIIGPVLEQPGIFRLPYWQNEVQVRLPIDATLIYGLKYLLVSNLNNANPDEVPDVQYGLRFETECEGLWFTIEHMYELSPEILPYFADVPTQEAATAHRIGPLAMSEGDLVGTSIGFPRDGNAFVAFGVFDDYERVPTAGPDFINAACYYDFFSPNTAAQLRSKTVARWPVAGDFCP